MLIKNDSSDWSPTNEELWTTEGKACPYTHICISVSNTNVVLLLRIREMDLNGFQADLDDQTGGDLPYFSKSHPDSLVSA